jgi:hypothetical protein
MPPEPQPRTRTDQFFLDCFGMNARNLLGLSTTIQCRTSSVTPAAFSVRNEHGQRRAPGRAQCRITLMILRPTSFPRCCNTPRMHIYPASGSRSPARTTSAPRSRFVGGRPGRRFVEPSYFWATNKRYRRRIVRRDDSGDIGEAPAAAGVAFHSQAAPLLVGQEHTLTTVRRTEHPVPRAGSQSRPAAGD